MATMTRIPICKEQKKERGKGKKLGEQDERKEEGKNMKYKI